MRFSDFFHDFVVPNACPASDATFVVVKGQDGYRNSLPLEDLPADDVMLADSLDGRALSMEHGLPIRLVAPAHYGYKSVKHVPQIEFFRNADSYRFPGPKLMEHHRARVALQERGHLPGCIYKIINRPIIGCNAWLFRNGAARYHKRTGGTR